MLWQLTIVSFISCVIGFAMGAFTYHQNGKYRLASVKKEAQKVYDQKLAEFKVDAEVEIQRIKNYARQFHAPLK